MSDSFSKKHNFLQPAMSTGAVILAVFSQSLMLLWAASAGIPVLLHFLARQYRKEIQWAAMQFLQRAQAKSARKFRLWQWLLLAIRCLILILLATALADPIINQTANALRSEATSTQHVLVVDGSLSMQTIEDGKSRWQRALQTMRTIRNDERPGDGYRLLLMTASPRWVIDEINFDREAVLAILEDLQPEDTAANVAGTVAELSSRLRPRDREATVSQTADSWSGPTRITFFTDLQASNWIDLDSVSELAKQFEIEIIDVSRSANVANSAVTQLGLTQGLTVAGKTLTFRSASERAGDTFGQDAAEPTLTQFLIDGNVQESRRTSASQTQSLQDWNASLSEGLHTLSVQRDRDALAADDQRFAVQRIRNRLEIMCVGDSADATRFAATALRSGTTGAITVREERPTVLSSSELKDVQIVMLCDVAALSQSQSDGLTRFSQRTDAQICCWLGSQTQMQNINNLLAKLLGEQAIQITGPSRAAQFRIDPLGYRHPITRLFEQHASSGLLTTPIFQFWETEIAEPSQLVRVLDVVDNIADEGSQTNGAPTNEEPSSSHMLLGTSTLPSGGSIIVCTTPVSSIQTGADAVAWNAMPLWPSFIPLVQETVGWLARAGEEQTSNFVAGRPLQIRLPAKTRERAFQLIDANGNARNLQRPLGSETLAVPAITKAGVYSLQIDEVAEGSVSQDDSSDNELAASKTRDREVTRIAVNPPRIESDLKRIAYDRFPDSIQITSANEGDAIDRTPSQLACSLATDGGRKLFPILLAAVLGLLLLESVVSRTMRSRFA